MTDSSQASSKSADSSAIVADLHSHTNASDGELDPRQLLEAARIAGVELFAITDHDTVAAYKVVPPGAYGPLTLIGGIEISTQWRTRTIHVVGLNVDPAFPGFDALTERQTEARRKRARKIAEKLAKYGYPDTLEGASSLAGDVPLSRVHFARYLVKAGHIKDEKLAFRRLLGDGKPADVKGDWLDLESTINCIHAAGGTSVLAHPAAYKLTRTKMSQLATSFAEAGGQAIEVISGAQDLAISQQFAQLADEHKLLASIGSDFHRPNQPWRQLGRMQALPANCRPVWQNWSL